MSTEIVRFCDSVAPAPMGVPDRRTECQRHYGHAGWHEAENPGEWPMPSFKTQWRERTPRTWELPPSPGPEVMRLRDGDGDFWTRIGSAWEGGGHSAVAWHELLVFGPLVDATEETTP